MKKEIIVTLLCVAWSIQGMQDNYNCMDISLRMMREKRLAPLDINLSKDEKAFERKCDILSYKIRDEKEINMYGVRDASFVNVFKDSQRDRYKMLMHHRRSDNLLKVLNHALKHNNYASEHNLEKKIFELEQIKKKSLNVKEFFDEDTKVFLKKHPKLYYYPSNYKEKIFFFMNDGLSISSAYAVAATNSYVFGEWGVIKKGISKSMLKKILMVTSLIGLGTTAYKYLRGIKAKNDIVKKDLKMFSETRKKAVCINREASSLITKMKNQPYKIQLNKQLNNKRENGIYNDIVVKTKGIN